LPKFIYLFIYSIASRPSATRGRVFACERQREKEREQEKEKEGGRWRFETCSIG